MSYRIALSLLIVLLASVVLAATGKVTPKLQPFPLTQVRLLDGPCGPCKTAQEANRRYLHMLDFDRLLHSFRTNAGLPAPGKPLGGWEGPKVEVRGHFIGHYLTACALMVQSTGDAKLEAKADRMVAELARCQKALGGEYLAAFPESYFDRLEAGKRVWVPYYTVHKIMAGLLDMHRRWTACCASSSAACPRCSTTSTASRATRRTWRWPTCSTRPSSSRRWPSSTTT